MIALLVIATILVFVGVDMALRLFRPATQDPDPNDTPTPLRPRLQAGLFLDPGHTWTQILPSGRVRVGVDEFVSQAVGCVDRIQPRQQGERIHRGDPLIVVEREGRRLALPSPLSGTVESCNDSLDHGAVPTRRTICALRPTNLGEELGRLQIGAEARQWLDREMRRLSAWVGGVTSTAAATMQDGGEPVSGLLQHLEPSAWSDFERRFLQSEEAS